MRKLLLTLSLMSALALAPEPAAAQALKNFDKPAGAPTIFLPDYGVTVGVWVIKYPFGAYLGYFVYNTAIGQWNAPTDNDNGSQYGDGNFDNDVAVMGGPAWVEQLGLPGVNKALAQGFPPKAGAPPSGSTPLDQANTALVAGYTIRMVNGRPAVSGK